ncbi:hypothetical protein ASZ90_016791 [hydrocarbon metagenome]|uniref:Uncharacterized protein n=1 Tax=hydrocarbon metagenome TaxID=938273 RepID=A0A0W8EBK6_9ZZZZ
MVLSTIAGQRLYWEKYVGWQKEEFQGAGELIVHAGLPGEIREHQRNRSAYLLSLTRREIT